MIRSGPILMIKDLAGKGKSAYAIGQEIGISKNTAREYAVSTASWAEGGKERLQTGSLQGAVGWLDAARVTVKTPGAWTPMG